MQAEAKGVGLGFKGENSASWVGRGHSIVIPTVEERAAKMDG